MKRITALRLFSVATAASTALFFTSCGEKKDSDGGAGGGDTKVEKQDTADSLTDELITQMNALADALGSAKDVATAEAAVKKLDGIGDDIATIAERLDKLDAPSEEEKNQLKEKMDKAQEAVQAKMVETMKTMSTSEEVGNILGPAMMKFGERMKKHEPSFERFGAKD